MWDSQSSVSCPLAANLVLGEPYPIRISKLQREGTNGFRNADTNNDDLRTR
jgi:hypothetical protein